MTHILVTGLPRSGTAFISQLLALHPDCISYHEMAAYGTDWRSTISHSPYRFVADCNTYGYMPEYSVTPDRTVWLSVNPEQSRQSAAKAIGREITKEWYDNLTQIAQNWLDSHAPLFINSGEMFTLSGCNQIWDYCFGRPGHLPDRPFPTTKVQQLIKLNVQCHNAHINFGEKTTFVV